MSSGKRDPIEQFIGGIFVYTGRFLKLCFYGIKALFRSVPIALIFLFFIIVSIVSWRIRGKFFELPSDMRVMSYILLGFALSSPILFIACIGSRNYKNNQKIIEKFKSIEFKSRGGAYPVLLGVTKEGKKDVFVFRSDIPIEDWRKADFRLENAFDCNVLSFEEGKSKKIIKMHTSKEKLPTIIDWKDEYIREEGTIVVGENLLGPISFNLNKSPHVLVAGETGSGKSVTLVCILWQMVTQNAKIYMTDFKGGVEFGIDFEKFGEVIFERPRFLEVLEMLTAENTARLAKLRAARVKNIQQYNKKSVEKLQRIVLFIDELAELMDAKGKNKEEKEMLDKIEGGLSTLARLSRATGINIIVGLQRPDHKVLPGQIKNNLPVRICGRFADGPASEIVLGNTRATTLPDIKGRMLFKSGADTTEFQGYFFDIETRIAEEMEEQLEEELEEDKTISEKEEETDIKVSEKEEEIDIKVKTKANSKINLNLDYKKVTQDYKKGTIGD